MLSLLDFFRNLPNPAKVVLVFVVTGLLVAGLGNFGDLFSAFNNQKVDELIEVQLLVETEESQPIPDVEVRFVTKGSPDKKYTNSSGYAQIKIPSRDDVDIVLTKKGYETLTETINLKNDPDRNKKFRLKGNLSSLNQSLIYKYYTAENDFFPLTISLLAPGFDIPIIKKILSEQLEIKTVPRVYKNSIFETIEKLKRETGIENEFKKMQLPGQAISISNSNGKTTISTIYSDDELTDQKEVINQSRNEFNSKKYSREGDFIVAPLTKPFLVNNEDSKYTSFLEKTVLQFPKLEDIGKYAVKDNLLSEDIYKDFWIRKVIQNNPDTRGFIGFDYSYISTLIPKENIDSIINYACESIYSLTLKAPSPYIKFIDIKNTSKIPVRIESLGYQLLNNNSYKLTSVEKRNLLFQNIPEAFQEENIYLEPEKHFLIPIEFGFNTDSYKKDYMTSQNIAKEAITKTDSLYFVKPNFDIKNLGENSSSEEITKTIMNKILINENFVSNSSSIESLLSQIPKRYAVGSILNINSIKFDGYNLPISPPNNDPHIYISQLFLEGSCPFLMVYNAQENYWSEIGTVLTDKNQKKLQREEIHNLGNNISQIRIEERESEITYIDALSILYTDPQTYEIHEVLHSIPQLKKADEFYFILRTGEYLDVNLKNIVPVNAINIKLKINGYYENIPA
jgi:hypothetical protein